MQRLAQEQFATSIIAEEAYKLLFKKVMSAKC